MDVSVLIISYNTCELTLACLRSIYAQTHDVAFEVIVLDNASTDGSAAAIAREFPQVRLIEPGKNLGFSIGNNVAARYATGEYLLLLNPDTVILDGAIQTATRFAMARPEAGIVGGRAFKGDGTLDYRSCHGRPTPWSVFALSSGLGAVFKQSTWFNPESLGPWKRDSVRVVDAVTGCFLLIGRRLWEQLDGFDESFFMYGEDTDLCLRASRLGKCCLICPDARLIHYGGQSDRVRADKVVRLFRAKVQLFQKHWAAHAVPLGVWSLKLHAWVRMSALGLLRWVQPARSAGYAAWSEVWRRRHEFYQGPTAPQGSA